MIALPKSCWYMCCCIGSAFPSLRLEEVENVHSLVEVLVGQHEAGDVCAILRALDAPDALLVRQSAQVKQRQDDNAVRDLSGLQHAVDEGAEVERDRYLERVD